MKGDGIYPRWSEEQAVGFAREALPLYRQAFADDLAGDSEGPLIQAFTVKWQAGHAGDLQSGLKKLDKNIDAQLKQAGKGVP